MWEQMQRDRDALLHPYFPLIYCETLRVAGITKEAGMLEV